MYLYALLAHLHVSPLFIYNKFITFCSLIWLFPPEHPRGIRPSAVQWISDPHWWCVCCLRPKKGHPICSSAAGLGGRDRCRPTTVTPRPWRRSSTSSWPVSGGVKHQIMSHITLRRMWFVLTKGVMYRFHYCHTQNNSYCHVSAGFPLYWVKERSVWF